MELLCFFFPSFISLLFVKKVLPKISAIQILIYFGLFSLVSNIICFFIITLITDPDYLLVLNASPLTFVLKYIILNAFLNIFLAMLYVKLHKSLLWKMEVEKVEE